MSKPKWKGFDVILVDSWQAPKPEEDQVKILGMPNIPKPLHGVAPRTVLGTTAWNFMRKKCYANADYKCEVCGKDLSENIYDKQAHELYSTDYINKRQIFERCICLCKRHHTEPGVHTGRALTMFKHGNVLMPKERLLAGIEDIFQRVHEYNTERRPKDEPELRLFYTYIMYTKNKRIGEEVKELIKKYDIKFYQPSVPEENRWGDWRLVIGNKEHPPLYKTPREWEEKLNGKDLKERYPGHDKTPEEKELDAAFDVIEKQLKGE